MKSLRPLLNVVLGLALLVQGVAFASAPPVLAASGSAAAVASALPCHGDEAAPADAAPCCDSACPDMLSCALAHMALAPASGLQLAPARSGSIAAPDRAADSVSLSTRLRPPIAFHA